MEHTIIIFCISHKTNKTTFFLFSGEGPRSRRYGRTAALWLTVQPYDEEDFFCPFPSNEAPVE
jgi:hypothetical protein